MKINDLRKALGMRQIDLAKDLEIAQNTLSQYENGKREPDFKTLKKIADYFEVSIDFLLDVVPRGSDEPDNEINEYLEILKTREDMRMLFKLIKNSSKDDVLRVVRIIESLK